MATKFNSPEEALKAISKAADDVESLMKSWQGGLAKEDEELPQEDEIEQTAEADPAVEDVPMDAPPEEAPMDAPPEEAPPEEAAPEGDQQAEMEQHASQLSDEELATLLEVLSNEMEKRHASEGEEAQAAPGAPSELQQSMKEEFKTLSKSFSSEIEKLKKSIDSLKSENASLKKKITLPQGKPASANANVRTMEKTAPTVEKMNKSETVDYLLGEMRKGNRSVTSDMVALANAVREDEELDYVHTHIKNNGVDIPNKR